MINLNSTIKFANRTLLGAMALFAVSTATATPSQANGYDAGFYAYVEDVAYWDVLNMRMWPASYSKKIAQIPDNGWGIWVERCIIKPGSSDWCKVKYANNWGWVNSRYLRKHQAN